MFAFHSHINDRYLITIFCLNMLTLSYEMYYHFVIFVWENVIFIVRSNLMIIIERLHLVSLCTVYLLGQHYRCGTWCILLWSIVSSPWDKVPISEVLSLPIDRGRIWNYFGFIWGCMPVHKYALHSQDWRGCAMKYQKSCYLNNTPSGP
jgi:hypothetical protein